MVRRVEAEPVFPGVANVLLLDPAKRPDGEIGEVDERRHDRTEGLCPLSRQEPLVQRSALVRLEMTETQPQDRCWIDDSREGVMPSVSAEFRLTPILGEIYWEREGAEKSFMGRAVTEPPVGFASLRRRWSGPGRRRP
jgi:hypothetical protein